MKFKPTMTPERSTRIIKSTQLMLILAEIIRIEHCSDLIDTTFKHPQVNQFAGRIAKDAKEIQRHLKTHPHLTMQVGDDDFVEEYACELHRVLNLFIGLPLSQIREVMDNLYAAAEHVAVAE